MGMRSSPISQTPSERALGRRILSPSAVALVVVFALTAYAGANMVGYLALANHIWFGPRDQPLANVLDAVSAWKNTSSVGALSRSLALELIMAETPNDAAALEGAIEEIAAVTPASTSAWQALAEIRKAQGAPMETVLPAFRMSALTGSHEGYFATQRAIFGLLNWNELPDSDRQIVIRDIVTSVGPENGAPGGRYRRILAAKPEPERNEIKAALLSSGRATPYVREALGI